MHPCIYPGRGLTGPRGAGACPWRRQPSGRHTQQVLGTATLQGQLLLVVAVHFGDEEAELRRLRPLPAPPPSSCHQDIVRLCASDLEYTAISHLTIDPFNNHSGHERLCGIMVTVMSVIVLPSAVWESYALLRVTVLCGRAIKMKAKSPGWTFLCPLLCSGYWNEHTIRNTSRSDQCI